MNRRHASDLRHVPLPEGVESGENLRLVRRFLRRRSQSNINCLMAVFDRMNETDASFSGARVRGRFGNLLQERLRFPTELPSSVSSSGRFGHSNSVVLYSLMRHLMKSFCFFENSVNFLKGLSK